MGLLDSDNELMCPPLITLRKSNAEINNRYLTLMALNRIVKTELIEFCTEYSFMSGKQGIG